MSSSAITGPILSDARRAPAGTAAAPSFAFNDSTGTGVYLVSPGVLGLSTAGVQRVVVDASGNVGIGTASPASKLHVNGSSGFIVGNNTEASNPRLVFTPVVNGPQLIVGYGDGDSNEQQLAFGTGNVGTERMRIDANGNVTIGTESAGATATHRFNGSALNFSRYSGAIYNGSLSFPPNNTQSAPIRLQSFGDNSSLEFRAGETAGTYAYLSVVGNWTGSSATGGKIDAVAGTGGARLSAGATSWTAISDENKKVIIEPINDAFNKVRTLRAVIGRYKFDDENKRRSFLIAQDVQAVLPEAVEVMDESDGTLGVRYTETIPLLVAAIKEQQEIIEKLEARLAALESK